ncbi:MAG: hypothetical protein ACE5DR_06695 [Thermodesulfobacteriota bacterium]
MGLIQREIEARGIPTASISILRKFTEDTKAPRAMFLKWPLGHPVGEPFKEAEQTFIVKRALKLLEDVDAPGAIIDPPYRWKRYDYMAGE